jgi:hypothetical protein
VNRHPTYHLLEMPPFHNHKLYFPRSCNARRHVGLRAVSESARLSTTSVANVEGRLDDHEQRGKTLEQAARALWPRLRISTSAPSTVLAPARIIWYPFRKVH